MGRYCIEVCTGYGPGPGGMSANYTPVFFSSYENAASAYKDYQARGIATTLVIDLDDLPF